MTADLGPAATPRPIPTPEDRMAAARTDREYADRIPAPRPLTTDRTNSHHRDLHQHIAGLEADLRSQTRAVRELTAQLDQLRATANRYAKTGATALHAINRVHDTINRLSREGLATIWTEDLRKSLDGTPPPSSVPPRRVQEEPACTCYPSGFSPGTYEGPMRDCPVHGELSAEARP